MRKNRYARVSTTNQNVDCQVSAFRAEKCDEILRARATGKAVKGRPART
jgi:hypothetical protein